MYQLSQLGSMQSAINGNQATSSPELLTRRAAWEEAQVHANAMAVSDAGHHAPIDATPKVPSSAPSSVPPAVPSALPSALPSAVPSAVISAVPSAGASAGASQSNMVQSCTAAQAAACKVAVVNHLATMYNESQENREEPAAPPSHIETQIITREAHQSRNADKAQQAEQLPGQGTSSVGDKGKKLAASVAEEHISEAPRHSPIDGSDHPNQPEDHPNQPEDHPNQPEDHPNQPEDQEGNGRVFGRVPTTKVPSAFGLH